MVFIWTFKSETHYSLSLDNDTIICCDIIKKVNEEINKNSSIFYGRPGGFFDKTRPYIYFEKYDNDFLKNISFYRKKHINGAVVLINNKLLRKKITPEKIKEKALVLKEKFKTLDKTYTLGWHICDECFLLDTFPKKTSFFNTHWINESLGTLDNRISKKVQDEDIILHLLTYYVCYTEAKKITMNFLYNTNEDWKRLSLLLNKQFEEETPFFEELVRNLEIYSKELNSILK